ncbi:MAG: hypothetical protein Q4G64_07640, partial [bacterium]|nr:hypothetical protein [bacterium]
GAPDFGEGAPDFAESGEPADAEYAEVGVAEMAATHAFPITHAYPEFEEPAAGAAMPWDAEPAELRDELTDSGAAAGAGVVPPSRDRSGPTWDELMTLCTEIKADGIFPFAFTGQHANYPDEGILQPLVA